MTQHYHVDAVWASGPSSPVSAMRLVYTYSLLPDRALSKTLLFVLRLLQTRDKKRCGSVRLLSNLQPCYDNCIAHHHHHHHHADIYNAPITTK